MSASRTCPHCQLENPPGAQRCDCGYDFDSGTVRRALVSEQERAAIAPSRISAYKVAMWLLTMLAVIRVGLLIYHLFTDE